MINQALEIPDRFSLLPLPNQPVQIPLRSLTFVSRDGLIRDCRSLQSNSSYDCFVGQALFDVWPGESVQTIIRLLQAAFFTGAIQFKTITSSDMKGLIIGEVTIIPLDSYEAMILFR